MPCSPQERRQGIYKWARLEDGAAGTRLELLEEIITLIIHEDECGEVLHLYLPDCLHAELRILYALDGLDILLGEDSGRTTN